MLIKESGFGTFEFRLYLLIPHDPYAFDFTIRYKNLVQLLNNSQKFIINIPVTFSFTFLKFPMPKTYKVPIRLNLTCIRECLREIIDNKIRLSLFYF